MNRYFKQVGIFILILAGIVIAWNYVFPSLKVSPWWPFYLAFFVLITATVHLMLMSSLKKKPQKFIGMFMAVSLSKLFIYLTALILNVIYSPFHKASVIAPFLFFYLAFTFFEVRHLLYITGKKGHKVKVNVMTGIEKPDK